MCCMNMTVEEEKKCPWFLLHGNRLEREGWVNDMSKHMNKTLI